MVKRIQIFDYQEFNNLIDNVEKYTTVEYDREYDKLYNQSLANTSYVKFKPKNCYLTTRYGPELTPCTYIFTRDHTNYHLKTGSEEYRVFVRALKEYKVNFDDDINTIELLGIEDGKFQRGNAALQEGNPKFDGVNVKAYQYDLNSAYLSCLYDKIPDCRFPSFNTKLKENEIGFYILDTPVLITTPGTYVDISFPLVESPKSLKRYCDRWFERKQTETDKAKKMNIKHQIVDSIGYLQYHNPWLRSYIVESCNNYMKELRDKYKEHYILINTDAIYSDIPLPLDIGPNLGQFKSEVGYMVKDGLDYKSEDFGDCLRGVLRDNYYEIVNNRLVYIGE